MDKYEDWQVEVTEPAVKSALLEIAERKGFDPTEYAKEEGIGVCWLSVGSSTNYRMYGYPMAVGGTIAVGLEEAVRRLLKGPPKRESGPKKITTIDFVPYLDEETETFDVLLLSDGSIKVGCTTVEREKVDLICEAVAELKRKE